ncbi:Ser-Thr-rich glycosyl-phosphatidyl-inositol-anchored membrane family-domain-containing protein [Aspergillus coremiiformis]|uniref:Ser-Thr-rich glycosyl-phosphatidyl-inositol-anchored membrane family-domain-containing protein n=1 Tax=Aspergillus coremiiformis TaxID=138285 RepID=A0A5N6Z8J2_9EURO|nr:Ser-Thr-rich glycosyl-phosphatidyl-inositol-anchored membrane family-domain-containing protein [Aspergillus coremiiformis]
MRFFQIASVVAYAASSLALTITSPQTGDKVDFSQPYTVKWTTVDSDPDTFNINLVSQTTANNKKEIAKNVKSSDGKYTIEKLLDIDTGNGYQLNFESSSQNNTGILAQSHVFNVTKVAEPTKSTQTSTTQTATESTSAPTDTSAGAPSFKVPAAGSLMFSLFALAL